MPDESSNRSRFERTGIFVLHSMTATVVTVLIVLFTDMAFEKWIGAERSDRIVGGPFFFPFLVVGFGLGYLINKQLKSKSAQWVWVLPLLLFSILLTDQIRYPDAQGRLYDIWLAYFGNNDTNCGGTECLYELLGTWPLFSAMAYAIGSLAARKRYRGLT